MRMSNLTRLCRLPRVTGAALIIAIGMTGSVQAQVQTFTTLHTFLGPDGATPYAGLTIGGDGNFYGSTYTGVATSQFGTIFKMTSAGLLTTLHTFAGSDGSGPYGSLALGGDGNFYGTTYAGGASNLGTVFQVTPSGALTTLHNFAGPEGSHPLGGLTLGTNGNFYGTASAGGAKGDGTVFEVTTLGVLTTIFNFDSIKSGSAPYSALTLSSDGNFYGTTENGGANSYYGTLFRITPLGTLTTLYSFGFTDGSGPYASLTQGTDGNFYGSTSNGGSNIQFGTLFQLTSAGVFTTLHNFAGLDGTAVEAPLALGPDGNFYGTSVAGGSSGSYGTIFKVTPAGALTTLNSFVGTDASNPTSGLTLGADGNFYGTSSGGGSAGEGTVFRIVTCPFCTTTSVISSGSPSASGGQVTFTATVSASSGSGAGTPTGSVNFTDNGAALGTVVLVSGTAALNISSLTPGVHAISAGYMGDATFQPSSGTFQQTVVQSTTVTGLSSNLNPSGYNQPVTFVAQVTPGAATGTITFADNGSSLGTVNMVAGAASYLTASLGSGNHSVTATYSGDGQFQTSAGTIAEVVSPATTLTGLSSSVNPTLVGQQSTFTATVSGQFGGSPTGAVTFLQDGNQVGSPVALTGGQAAMAINFSQLGSSVITASYSGDTNYVTSNASVTEVVNSSAAMSSSLTTLHSFNGQDGNNSLSGLLLGSDGNYYGTTQAGGANGLGTLFQMTPSGTITTLYSFAGADGSGPSAGLILGTDGKFYGTTSSGGSANDGTVFQFTPGAPPVTLRQFGGTDGASPGPLLLGTDGKIYGTTYSGGSAGDGTIYVIDSSNTFTSLYSFSGADGSNPKAGLTQGTDGNFYGTTENGGTNLEGTVFQFTAPGTLHTLHNFNGADGSLPDAGLTLATDGNFYGTTSTGGGNPPYGTAFKIATDGTFATLHNFGGSDGSNPVAALTVGPDGNFYGTTTTGGANPLYGTVFSISSTGVFTSRYNFAGTDGGNPSAQLLLGPDSNFYGTTSTGAPNGSGSVFRLVVCPACTVTTVTSNGSPSVYGNSVTLTGTVQPSSGLGTPTGSITFADSGAPLGSATLSGGIGTLTVTTLGPGQHSITAAYGGDGTFQPSNGAYSQTVTRGTVVTGLVSNPNPSSSGQSVTFTATVTQGAGLATPTGSVTFTDGNSNLSTVNLSGNSAVYVTTALSAGTHLITATYTGDSNYVSSSATVSQVVNLAASSTKVVSTMNPSQFGQSVTLVATVSAVVGSGTPTGSVTFTDGTTSLGPPANLVGGSASLILSALAVGTHSITVSYGGDSKFGLSTGTLSQVVNLAPTTTAVTSSLNPSTYNQPLTFTATVTGQAGSGTPTGSVSFTSNGASLGSGQLTGGTVQISSPVQNAGTFTILGSYGGSSTQQGSSGSLSQLVKQATTTAILTASPNPALVNQAVKITATVTGQYGGTPTGTVTFSQNGTKIGSPVTVTAGQASVSYTFSKAGTSTLTAVYSGSSNYLGTTAAGITETINAAIVSTKTALKSSGSPSTIGTPVTFTATVTPSSGSIPNGETVTFYYGSTVLGTGLTASGAATFSTSGLPVGSDSISATYPGDANFQTSTSTALVQTVTKNATSVSLTSNLNPSTYGKSITFTAKVTSSGPVPTGTVAFKNGGTSIGSGTLSNGVVTFSTAGLPVGTDSISATYGGDASSATSSSATLSQVVSPAVTTTTIVSSKNPAKKGTSVTFTATVTASGLLPSGTVVFSNGATTLGTGTLVNGKCSVSTTTLPSGADVITAAYGGNTNFAVSSAKLTETVN